MHVRTFWLTLVPMAFFAVPAQGGEADVVAVEVRRTAPETFTFDVTVRHADQGWKHYADRWDIVGPGDKVLGSRKLWHPHDDEQPFTRSLGGVRIPSDVGSVVVRAHDSQHGLGGKEMVVDVPHGQ